MATNGAPLGSGSVWFFLGGQSRLKAGCGQNCPPSKNQTDPLPIFQKSEPGAGNLWRQPVRGGAPTQLTHFTTEEIFNFAVRRDGRLAILRGHSLNDVVSIRDAH